MSVKHNAFILLFLILVMLRVFLFQRGFELYSVNLPMLAHPFYGLRTYLESKVFENFNSPSSYLLLGILLGSDFIKYDSRFNDVLVDTGTIHIAVVSGYNLGVVLIFIEKVLGSIYGWQKITAVVILTLIYALITGFEPPVVRAWVMLFLSLFVRIFGRRITVYRSLMLSACIIVMLSPSMALSLSFQLSFLATLGLIVFSEIVQGVLQYVKMPSNSLLLNDFISSLSAQLMVIPLLSYRFGVVNLLGVISNSLVLWLIPYITFLGYFFLAVSIVFKSSNLVVGLASFVTEVPISILVFLLEKLASLSAINLFYKMSYVSLCIYYCLLFFLIYLFKYHSHK